MDTLYIAPQTWDLVLDASGNIALASVPYALAQDAASAIKTFASEVYYNTALGVPYFAQILGEQPPVELMRAKFAEAAKTVPEVIAAKVVISAIINRRVTGQVQVTNSAGIAATAGF